MRAAWQIFVLEGMTAGMTAGIPAGMAAGIAMGLQRGFDRACVPQPRCFPFGGLSARIENR
jgi:hypothetical protein